MLQVLYNDYSRVNILINEDEEMIFITDDMDVLDRFSVSDYLAPNYQELIERFEVALKTYFHIEEDKTEYKNIRENLYQHAIERFLKSDFLKEYKEYHEVE